MQGLLLMRIAECSACGYVGNLGSLSVNEDFPEELALLVSSAAYAACGAGLADVARRFLRRALIADEWGDERLADQASLHAAWVCNAEGDRVGARACRDRAVEHWYDAIAEGDALTEDNDSARDAAVIAETLRRADRFSDAIEVCKEALADPGEGEVRATLEKIRDLASRQNGAPTSAS